MGLPLLAETVGLFGLAVAVVVVCHRLRLPTVVGLLLTGLLTGPHGLGLINDPHEVEVLAEIGVVSLLFTIGLEFSLSHLLKSRSVLLVAGPLQVGGTILLTALLGRGCGLPLNAAIFLGMLASLSSTAVVLSLLESKAAVDSPPGRVTLGLLIFQDLAIVPFMLLLPLLGGEQLSGSQVLGRLVLPLVVFGVGLPILTRWLVPELLAIVTRTRDRQLFLLTTVFLALGVAWASSTLGLSLALGAFLAGLTIAESEFSHRVLGTVLPLRDLLTSFFFISVGMLLNTDLVLAQPGPLLLATVALVLLKAVTVVVAVSTIGYPLRIAASAALSLAQLGEFTFILLTVGERYHLLSETLGQTVLGVAVLTMMATPLLMNTAPAVAEWVSRLRLPARIVQGAGMTEEQPLPELHGHLVVIGYGLNGRNLAEAARTAGIPYVVIEMNHEVVRRRSEAGEPILYGDATHDAVLTHAGVPTAKVVVVAISDAAATRRVIDVTRRMNPDIFLIARTRYVGEIEALHELGADQVIPEEFETSIEIFVRVMQQYLVPAERIESLVAQVRQNGYAMLRRPSRRAHFEPVLRDLPGIDLAAVTVGENSPLVGKSLAELELRQRYEVNLLAVQRAETTLAPPAGQTVLCAGDRLIVMGNPEPVAELGKAAHGQD
ncbi:MAG: cation:proton antiporter [Armatimonadetes bacterium]|nr:cation:proton antiporter [Armatimonadota bacterium]